MFRSLPPFVSMKQVRYGDKEDTKYTYSIYNLENDYIQDADLKNRIWRSVVKSEDTVLAVAPAKSVPKESFLSNVLVGDGTDKIVVNEIIEGTMINLFWDPHFDRWEIATKRGIGGKYFFFRNKYDAELDEPEQKQFREMFLEAFVPLNDLPFDKSYCYSFVLQHPSNHIVLRVEAPAVYLVMTYKLGEEITYVNPKKHPDYDKFREAGVKFARDFCYVPIGVSFDELFVENTNLVWDKIPELEEILANPLNEFTSAGIMITDQKTGLRTKFYNKKYLEVKSLRGNNPNLHYQYLMLRKIDKVSEFLQYFPMYRQHFSKFLQHFQLFTERIHKLYWEVHVKKTLHVLNIPEKHDRFFVEKLHYEVFLPRHKADAKFFITRKEVAKFLDGEKMMIPF